MTSECFVYIWLPGSINAVPCGRFAIEVNREGLPIGRFVYGKSYLARNEAVPLDPVELSLSERVYETAAMKGVFGPLRDAGPDYWGRRLIERHAGVVALEEVDYLLESPDDRAGALGFGRDVTPPAPRRNFNRTIHLAQLQAIADAILKEEMVDGNVGEGEAAGGGNAEIFEGIEDHRIQAEDLLLMGTSMGGARPKTVIEDAEALWIAKFNRADDRWNNARIEHAMLILARECGISTADSRLTTVGGRDVLLVKRFDRFSEPGGYTRARMVSGLTLLRAEDTNRSRDRWSYPILVEELRRVVQAPQQDATELFKRMCFNALISNTDDHPRNHAIIAKEHTWKLSPAYDLTPSPQISEERRDLAMTIGAYGRYANAQNLMSEAGRFLLSAEEAKSIIDTMERKVSRTWYETARRVGATERDCDATARAFVYPGFRLQADRA